MFGLASRLFGQDPKLDFRKPGAGISLLASKTIAQDDPYWSQYWLLFDSPTDVVTLMDSLTLSTVLQRRPENLVTLIHVLATHLFTLLSTSDFPGTSTSSASSIALLGTLRNQAMNTQPEVDLAKEALNCIRVLSRVAPFVMKPQTGNGQQLEDTIFWTSERVKVERIPELPTKELGSAEAEAGQFVIDDDEDEDGDGDGDGDATPTQENKTGTVRDEDEWEDLPPLATRLLSALVDLAFVPGFTVAEESKTPEGAVAYVIWESGIAAPPTTLPPTSQTLLSNRLEVLRLLNLLLSLPSLLTSPASFPSLPNRWRDALISGDTLERKVVLCFLCSVLNTAFAGGKPVVPTQPGAFGLGGALGAAEKLGGVVLRREDVKGLLTGACLQLLAILFSEHAEKGPSLSDSVSSANLTSPFTEPSPRMGESTASAPESGPPPPNTFSFYLSKLHRRSDFDFIISGVFTILNQSLNQPLLPGVPSLGNAANGGGKAGWALEALIVLWRMIEYNPKLLAHLAGSQRGGEFCVYLVTFCLEFKDDETHLGLVRLSAFILQSLTSESRLEPCINSSVDLKLSLRGKYNVPGTLADFIIVSIYTLIFTTKARLSSLYPAFVLTIANLSPYLKALSSVSSTRLLQLFLAFSAPSFLLMEEGNPRLVFYMLETFNNLIHFQLSDNPHTVYSIIRSYKRFEDLSTFTLAGGIAEARRIRRERKTAAAATASSPASMPLSSIPESRRKVDADDEKEASKPEETEMTTVTTSRPGAPITPAPLASEDLAVSEKARGKMRARNASVSSLPIADLNISGVEEEGEFVGKNGFVPTESWVASWREGLPLDSILIMLAELRPKVLELPASSENEAAIEFLSSASLVGHLPPPPAVRARRFIYTPQSITWLASLFYGSIYLNTLELLRDVQVQLFAVAQARRGSSAADLVNGFISRVGRNGSS